MKDTINRDRLKEKIESLGPWLMRHEIVSGLFTEIMPGSAGYRQGDFFEERGGVIFSFLKDLYGGALTGKKVLDIGCASGFFSFMAARLGAESVRGIDARQVHIDQANFLKEHFGFSNSFFERLTVSELMTREDVFDCILMLDIFHILSNPIQVIDYLFSRTRDVLILDVQLYKPGCFTFSLPWCNKVGKDVMVLCDQSLKIHNKCGIEKLALLPSYSAVLTLLSSSGFKYIFKLTCPQRWKNKKLPLARYFDGKAVILVALKDKGLAVSVNPVKAVAVP